MFNNFKRGQNTTARLAYKKLSETKSVAKAMEWLRRNYPEAFKKGEK